MTLESSTTIRNIAEWLAGTILYICSYSKGWIAYITGCILSHLTDDRLKNRLYKNMHIFSLKPLTAHASEERDDPDL
jgi:hypothetical protein